MTTLIEESCGQPAEGRGAPSSTPYILLEVQFTDQPKKKTFAQLESSYMLAEHSGFYFALETGKMQCGFKFSQRKGTQKIGKHSKEDFGIRLVRDWKVSGNILQITGNESREAALQVSLFLWQ